MGAKSSSRKGASIRLIAVHTNEGNNPADVYPDLTAENLAAYLNEPTTLASYHKITDDDSTINYVPDELAAWALRSGNPISLNICFTGWARWDTAEWMRHPMLKLGAVKVREWCNRYNIPMRKIDHYAIERGEKGIIGHYDWTLTGDGSHTDPGRGFPWTYFIKLIQEGTVPSQQEWDELMGRVRTIEHQLVGTNFGGWPSYRYGVPPGSKNSFTDTDYLREIDRENNSWFGLQGRPGGDTDRIAGHILSTRAELRKAAEKWDAYMNRSETQ